VTLLPRTIRLDASDAVVFARAAEPGEWAVPGTFIFWGRPAESLSRKEAIAFRSGFLGVESFGHSTLVVVQEARAVDRAAMVAALARGLVAHLGAPDVATAAAAAEEEVALAESLCRDHAPNTLIALYRRREGDEIREQFRTLRPRRETAFDAPYLQGHDRAFHIVEEDEDGIDLLALRGGSDA
jgi:ADP-ribose pyrophosphatase YjhB (NUDIX family)